MNIKEKVINESIKRADKRIAKLNSLIYAKPLSEVIEIREKARKITQEHKGDYKKIGELIEPLATKEQQLLKLAKSQVKNGIKWIHELSALTFERGQLINELYYHKQRSI